MKTETNIVKRQQAATLDPVDWNELKQLGHRMMEDMITFLQTIREQPVWRKPTDKVKTTFRKELPLRPQSFQQVYDEFKENILPYYLGNIHPRFWSWVMGTGSAQGMLAEMLAAGMNCNVGIGDQAPMYVDQQVIEWCKQMVDFPSRSSGILVSGASAANLNALIVARNSANDWIRKKGIHQQKKLLLYASAETHSCIQKAAEIIGIGSEAVRKVRVNNNFEMDAEHLEEMIRQDKANGFQPFCVVGNVGTVNTGAIDPLDKISLICLEHNLWFHIDGAFGALLKMLPEYKEKLQYMELADSIAFDLHKWMYMPYEAGVVLVKDANRQRASFALQPDYILNHDRGISAGPELTSNFGIDLSRNFKALKVWMLLKEQGIEKYIQLMRQNLDQAKYLAQLIRRSPLLELMAPVSMNIVCFRYKGYDMNAAELNDLNREILMQLHEQGIAAPSYTRLNGHFCLRVAHVNHRTRYEDFTWLAEKVVQLGKTVHEKNYSAGVVKEKRVA
jgi:glutamate/tyrosine decarboxylase-like PLP-dependent enzyme